MGKEFIYLFFKIAKGKNSGQLKQHLIVYLYHLKNKQQYKMLLLNVKYVNAMHLNKT